MWKAVRQEDVENTSLKDLYNIHVIKGNAKTLKNISTEIVECCVGRMFMGCELPYKFTVDSKGINSVHDLKPYLKEVGIVANLCFYKQMTNLIEVTVTQFTK